MSKTRCMHTMSMRQPRSLFGQTVTCGRVYVVFVPPTKKYRAAIWNEDLQRTYDEIHRRHETKSSDEQRVVQDIVRLARRKSASVKINE